jgi:asparagine synthase (glutamine-hydrolysing)
MIAAMRHRGPDDCGIWSDRDSGVTLGSCRLAIQDLSDAAHMPMSSPDGSCWITYNGEVYNFSKLRDELEGKGYAFRSHSDTEVILAAYQEWGVQCLEHLRGMFAFAIFDSRMETGGGRLFIARDRFGIKPLYWTMQEGKLLFASELKALLASGMVSCCIDIQAFWDYLSLGAVPAPRTLISNVNALLPGHALILEKMNVRVWKYWDLVSASESVQVPTELEEAAVELRRQLEEAIQLHMVADVPVGAFLSGGIDSSTICGLMSREMEQPLRTYSIGFEREDRGVDELPFAVLAAKHFGTTHEEYIVTGSLMADEFEAIIQGIDQPSIDGVNTYFVSKAARSDVTVALSGLGGDELFAGYPQFARFDRASSWLAHGNRALARFSTPLKKVLPGRYKLRAEFYSSTPLERHVSIRRLLSEENKYAVIKQDILNDYPPVPISDYYAGIFVPCNDIIAEVSNVEIRGYMANTLLRDADAMSMSHSLELRVPFLDHKLAEFAYALPGSFKLRNQQGKLVLKEAMKDLLPQATIERAKVGFDMPMSAWIAGPLRNIMDETLELPEARMVFSPSGLQHIKKLVGSASWYLPWSAVVLVRWMALHGATP